ncbi:hypothetical protein F4811DRAFT_521670 [Daldinia bambusicola]|nr:hypothetical protein F4811DRAFT_521670 [Daldinia bambusicola]
MYNRYARPLLYHARTTAKASPLQLASKPVGVIRRGAQAVVTSRPCWLVYHHYQGQGQGRRTFAVSASAAAPTPTEAMAEPAGSQAVVAPQFSAGVDEAALTQTLETLLASAGRGGRWVLIDSGEGLERSFKFKTFAKTWDFMTAVSLQCKLKNHHPEWSNVSSPPFPIRPFVYHKRTIIRPAHVSFRMLETQRNLSTAHTIQNCYIKQESSPAIATRCHLRGKKRWRASLVTERIYYYLPMYYCYYYYGGTHKL